MSESTDDTEYHGPTIPERLGENLQIIMDLDERPRTFGDWVDAMAFVTRRDGIDVDPDTLCTTDESPHHASFNGTTQYYQCAQDAFIVPFLAADVETVDIHTESAVRGEEITIRITESTVDVDPPSTVLSFGVPTEVSPPPSDVASPARAYEWVCPYGHAFVSHEEYAAWAADIDALTMPVGPEDTLAFARALGRVA